MHPKAERPAGEQLIFLSMSCFKTNKIVRTCRIVRAFLYEEQKIVVKVLKAQAKAKKKEKKKDNKKAAKKQQQR